MFGFAESKSKKKLGWIDWIFWENNSLSSGQMNINKIDNMVLLNFVRKIMWKSEMRRYEMYVAWKS